MEENNLLNNKFGQRLRATRLEKGISQDELALISNLSRSYVCKLDRGKGNISLKVLYQLAEALEVQPQELLP